VLFDSDLAPGGDPCWDTYLAKDPGLMQLETPWQNVDAARRQARARSRLQAPGGWRSSPALYDERTKGAAMRRSLIAAPTRSSSANSSRVQ
jgi:hypothetical protein